MSATLLQPVFVLVAWTLIVLIWMVARRVPAMAKITLAPEDMLGARGSDLEGILPKQSNWPAHNYTHLMEQPTIFYAVTLGLAVMGHATPLTLGLAWAYVGLRIAHSLWQILVNTLPVRTGLFLVSTLVLIALAVVALLASFKDA